MKAKTNFVQQTEINIELLISEGITNHKKLRAQTDDQAKQIEVESKQYADRENALELTLEKMNVY